MTDTFSNIAILGSGLLGGSLALALQTLPNPPQVRLWARREDTVSAARQRGIPGATGDLAHAVADACLVVLCVPVGTMPELLESAVAAGLPANCLVTDVGSVKKVLHETLPAVLSRSGHPFIGSHPMAGSEKTGISAASASLFAGAACLLTNDGQADPTLTGRLERFWQSLDCETTWMGAAEHDALVARISHLPHLLAASAASVCLADPALGRFGGGGLRDTTRVASGNTEMWTEILTENHRAIIGPLRESIADLTKFLAFLETADHERVREWLSTAKDRRDHLAPGAPVTFD
jgi:prephenate dehydrogenase